MTRITPPKSIHIKIDSSVMMLGYVEMNRLIEYFSLDQLHCDGAVVIKGCKAILEVTRILLEDHISGVQISEHFFPSYRYLQHQYYKCG